MQKVTKAHEEIDQLFFRRHPTGTALSGNLWTLWDSYEYLNGPHIYGYIIVVHSDTPPKKRLLPVPSSSSRARTLTCAHWLKMGAPIIFYRYEATQQTSANKKSKQAIISSDEPEKSSSLHFWWLFYVTDRGKIKEEKNLVEHTHKKKEDETQTLGYV